jgi:hypothetical protein
MVCDYDDTTQDSECLTGQDSPSSIHLKTHPVVNLIVGKCYVIFKGRIPGTRSFQFDKSQSTDTESASYHFLS